MIFITSVVFAVVILLSGPAPVIAANGQRARRQATSSDLSTDEIAAYLDKHNELRSQVTPTAADMKYMTWDDDLATMAQQWSDKCIWDHGQPDTNISPFDDIGQNLYLTSGATPTTRVAGDKVVQSWYNEVVYYTLSNNTCTAPYPLVCGHYTQVVWADSYAVGCAQAYCPTGNGANIIVACNYGPTGNYNRQPYISGAPCTQCDSGIGQCYGNQCRLCSESDTEDCVCGQVCYNCGTLDSNTCTCTCPNGFYGVDCGVPCEDTHNSCNNGWYAVHCDNYSFVREGCPLMCSLCVGTPDADYTCAQGGRV